MNRTPRPNRETQLEQSIDQLQAENAQLSEKIGQLKAENEKLKKYKLHDVAIPCPNECGGILIIKDFIDRPICNECGIEFKLQALKD